MDNRQRIITFKILRLASGLSAERVAAALSLKEASYRKYEYSDRLPSVETLQALTRIYKCSLEEITEAYNYHKSVRDMRKNGKIRNKLKRKVTQN
ncbi:transcriptional regulator with XRE-family HTH domain [Clostridium acetobutylicum]|uniref:Phage related transcriptional regulator (Xre family) n=1 Tax=Clostridium acetobutylicum (strain ATCC 824 / DSM 792 / JCM 1419 / IAM 19013 / LMG 5710 / NBRC 13948 / NRRL B-527 / VKM B-1787 / 2291 / W) TaxID=272562 RepID=Q97HR2_CLOAB|nr:MULTISPECIES: helix-turn-helix transcriptional regulator [Clostridium]AAK79908.1 Phage related transcriptional regulator (Xre family) [Clostridium acetobutylicum ATCC 824]ADZ21000.1 Phage related transcriptional regulator (Xre family) [Clostridium acetobutylicum EA 2018]AEI32085.1 phage related transcriptional regulator [Clostridium acetobutylicum DSM 1731]AWV79659.1 XRE family transcriptional regulator [Clostridium acetobutylicum]MBC2394366.1 helix-turn-helix transcriptional regulator [Clo